MIYFDNAATTKNKPQVVIDAVVNAMVYLGNSGRGVHEASLDAARSVFAARESLNRFFGGYGASQVVFTSNSTQALNIAIKGIVSPGDQVVTTVLEHNSVLRPLYELMEEGVSVSFAGCDEYGRLDYEEMERLVSPETKAIVCTHASNLTGNLTDLARVSQIAKKNGAILIVDGSQTAGIYPINISELGVDVFCFTGHKSMLGPQGTGGMIVRKGLEIRPLLTGGSGVQTYSKTHPKEMPTALEAGTLNGHGIAGLAAAVGYIEDKGIETLRAKELALMERFYQGVKGLPGVKVYGDITAGESVRCPIVTLNIREYDSSEVSDELFMSYEIATRAGAHCAPLMHQALGTVSQGAVRFSFSHNNTEDEVDTAINALKELTAPGAEAE